MAEWYQDSRKPKSERERGKQLLNYVKCFGSINIDNDMSIGEWLNPGRFEAWSSWQSTMIHFRGLYFAEGLRRNKAKQPVQLEWLSALFDVLREIVGLTLSIVYPMHSSARIGS